MRFEEYAELAMRTQADYSEVKTPTPEEWQIICGVFGMIGEVGEMAEMVKKWLFQGHELDYDNLIEELGDSIWYWNQIVNAIPKVTASEIAELNIEKLRARYPHGFSADRSLNREL